MYYYLRNGQNDIIGILNSLGVQVVSYVYDSWGNPISITGTLATTIGADNPFRYRGYYFDSDTGLYYLNSRYYDSTVGRFINSDDFSIIQYSAMSLTQLNLYSYCSNDPINRTDPTGYISFGKHWWNKVSFIALTIDVLIITIPALWSLCGYVRAKMVAQKLAQEASRVALEQIKNKSKKALRKVIVSLSVKLATSSTPSFCSFLIGFSGAIIDTIFTIAGNSIGGMIANFLDGIDAGGKDGYIFG
jgi:RHS repeat-associated protein